MIGIGALLALMLSIGVGEDPVTDRLYGRVLTAEGETLQGYIRWDRNESNWTDYLDGGKAIPAEDIREAERLDPDFAEAQRRQRSLVAFGVRISWDEDDESDLLVSASSIRFAHIASLIALDRRTALLRLRSGGEVRLRSSSTDVGLSIHTRMNS